MKRKGSITVFSALCLMLVASFLFALLEAGRVYGLDAYADMNAELGLESVCAEYQPQLWDKYHMLCLDGAYGGEEFSMEHVTRILKQQLTDNLKPDKNGKWGIDLFQMKLTDAEPDAYQLMTDGEGTAFIKQVSSYMKKNLPREAAEIIHEKIAQNREVKENEGAEQSIENADQAIKEAREKQKIESSESSEMKGETENTESAVQTEKTGSEEVKENPLDIVLELKRNAILGMVVPDISAVSVKEINLSENLLNRQCCQGNEKNAGTKQIDWYERILLLEYLDQYFSDYTNPSEEDALAYELEYILCGKESDKENLEGTVNRLLFLREAANVTHIISDSGKLNEAFIMANALAGFTGNPAVVKVVQIGVVAAWAYLESIQDVRTLLQGGKIALIKSREQWTVDTGNLLESFSGTARAKNCQNGLTYQDYLKQFLFVSGIKELAYRTMDVMEQNIKQIPQDRNCRMDHMICSMKYTMSYEAKPQFSGLIVVLKSPSELFTFVKSKSFSYIIGKAGVSWCLFIKPKKQIII